MEDFDYLVVGGGTAGCIIAARLSEDPDVRVGLVEWGPDDKHEERARRIRRWAEMGESEYDLDYRSVPQARGNSHIRQTRMRLLGGCANANTMISWRTLAADLDEWVALGATGWDPQTVQPYFDRLQTPITPIPPQDRNPLLADMIQAAATALDLPVQDRWNDGRLDHRAEGTGFFEIGYLPEGNIRSATSTYYLHPVADRPNLTVLLESRVTRIVHDGEHATGVEVVTGGRPATLTATREVVVCAGAIDTPRLLQLSGIGPDEVLRAAGVPAVVDLPVGENLMDHAEGLVVWRARRPVPEQQATGWDAGALIALHAPADRPDILMHFPVEPYLAQAEQFGAQFPDTTVAIAANVARPHSRGRVWITSDRPDDPPQIDYGYFTDPDGHDEEMLLQGIELARRIARSEPMASWIGEELFPAPYVDESRSLSDVARASHQTVYHVSGTCRMGAEGDPAAVLTPQLTVQGMDGLSVCDASIFPMLVSTNPVVTVMMAAERAVDLIRERQVA